MNLTDISPDQMQALNVLGVGTLTQVLVVLARMVGIVMVVPFLGSMNIPMTVRVAIAVMLTGIVAPMVVGEGMMLNLPTGGFPYVLLLTNQLLIGLMLGLVAAAVFHGIESAGRIIDTQRGSNITDLIAPQTGERTSPAGQWLMQFALVLFLVLGFHIFLIEAIVQSFQDLPPMLSLDWVGKNPMNGEMSEVVAEMAHKVDEVMIIAVKIAAPALLTILLTDVALGIINRGAPQVNVFMFSMPIKAVVGIAAMLTSLAALVAYLTGDGGLFQTLFGNGEDGGVSLPKMVELMRLGR